MQVSSSDAQQCKDRLNEFVQAWSHNEMRHNGTFLKNECRTYFSMWDNIYSRYELVEKMTFPQTAIVDMQLMNYAARIDDDQAAQSAILLASITNLVNGKREHLCFGGCFSNRLVKEKGKWLLETVRFELLSDDSICDESISEDGAYTVIPGTGTISLISGWKLTNDRIGLFMEPVQGQGDHTVLAEADAPWYFCGKQQQNMTDAEMIEDISYRICYAFDLNCFRLAKDCFAPPGIVKVPQLGVLGVRDATGYLKMVRQAMPRSIHACTSVVDVADSDQADVVLQIRNPHHTSVCIDESGHIQVEYEVKNIR